jgi:hypothetical protein
MPLLSLSRQSAFAVWIAQMVGALPMLVALETVVPFISQTPLEPGALASVVATGTWMTKSVKPAGGVKNGYEELALP